MLKSIPRVVILISHYLRSLQSLAEPSIPFIRKQLYTMRSSRVAAITGSTILFLTTLQGASAQACAAGVASEIKGNWYCSEVTAVTYANFPGVGSYERITDMDADSGECSSVRYDYSGSLSPLNEEVGSLFGLFNLMMFC